LRGCSNSRSISARAACVWRACAICVGLSVFLFVSPLPLPLTCDPLFSPALPSPPSPSPSPSSLCAPNALSLSLTHTHSSLSLRPAPPPPLPVLVRRVCVHARARVSLASRAPRSLLVRRRPPPPFRACAWAARRSRRATLWLPSSAPASVHCLRRRPNHRARIDVGAVDFARFGAAWLGPSPDRSASRSDRRRRLPPRRCLSLDPRSISLEQPRPLAGPPGHSHTRTPPGPLPCLDPSLAWPAPLPRPLPCPTPRMPIAAFRRLACSPRQEQSCALRSLREAAAPRAQPLKSEGPKEGPRRQRPPSHTARDAHRRRLRDDHPNPSPRFPVDRRVDVQAGCVTQLSCESAPSVSRASQ